MKILFVCLGNICRSPLAEGIFQHLVDDHDLTEEFLIDSCGTGSWHVGESPHQDSQRIALERGIDISDQRARQLLKGDFSQFDLLVAMDQQNRRDMEKKFRVDEKIICLREFDEERDSLDVPDPYYGGPEGFAVVFDIIERSCVELFRDLRERL